jgi:predicted Rossmann-fold nucleotide-binding protein
MRQTTPKIPETIDPQAMYSSNGQEAWRVLGIMAEFVSATERLRGIRPAVSMFGSARIGEGHAYYEVAHDRAQALRRRLLGDLGRRPRHLMEAANKGAPRAARRRSTSTSRCPHERATPSFQDVSLDFLYFFSRRDDVRALHASAYASCCPVVSARSTNCPSA